jgi:hypothetical protein
MVKGRTRTVTEMDEAPSEAMAAVWLLADEVCVDEKHEKDISA